MGAFRSSFSLVLCIIMLPVLLIFVSCTSGKVDFASFETEIGGENFILELAVTPEERSHGFMNRKSIPANHGMLFVYDHDQKMSFWMKNTSVPLSIAFISKDGIVKEIHHLQPFNEVAIQSKYSVRYALEMVQGRYREIGIGVGDKILDINVLAEVLHGQ